METIKVINKHKQCIERCKQRTERRDLYNTCFRLLAQSAVVLAGASCAPSQGQLTNPNVLFIMVDDLNDWIGVMNGHPEAITPNIDALVERGVFFTNAHCSQPVSTASRNSLLSGKHPATSGWYVDTKTMNTTYEEVMEGSAMLPQYFKDNGYNTYAVGKIFHNGICDYSNRKDDMWSGYAPSFWSKIEDHILEAAYGYRGYMFYPFPKDGGQLVQNYIQDFGIDTINYYKETNRFYSLCGGALDEEDIPSDGMYDEQIASWAVDKIGEIAESKSKNVESKDADPFMLAVGFIRPHVPYTAPRRYFDMYDPDKITMPEIPEDDMSDIPIFGKAIAYGSSPAGDWKDVNRSEGVDRELVHAYLASVTFMDEQLGKVISALDSSGMGENTIIILCSDHGQHLGEKRHYRKQALWEESTRVPMLICLPDGVGEKGAFYDNPVSLLDLYPTLVSLCGLPENTHLDGQDLAPIMWNTKSIETPPTLISWKYGNFAVRSNDWRYIQYRDGSQELYDHRTDPLEFTNLASDPAYASIIEEHRAYIPENPALPAGRTEFKGDAYEARISKWKKEGIPDWL